ncbi:MAG: barstar family protein [Actinobacteria bacterium]|nr:barstar family protein [Actinomycetota bacterium]
MSRPERVPGPLRAVLLAVGAAGCTPRVVSGPASKAEFLDAVAEAFAFPPWFGRNYDALADCLADLSWLPGGRFALVWVGWERLRAADPAAFDVLQEILAAAVTADRLAVYLVDDPPG